MLKIYGYAGSMMCAKCSSTKRGLVVARCTQRSTGPNYNPLPKGRGLHHARCSETAQTRKTRPYCVIRRPDCRRSNCPLQLHM